jgi:hypothetical protein
MIVIFNSKRGVKNLSKERKRKPEKGRKEERKKDNEFFLLMIIKSKKLAICHIYNIYIYIHGIADVQRK